MRTCASACTHIALRHTPTQQKKLPTMFSDALFSVCARSRFGGNSDMRAGTDRQPGTTHNTHASQCDALDTALHGPTCKWIPRWRRSARLLEPHTHLNKPGRGPNQQLMPKPISITTARMYRRYADRTATLRPQSRRGNRGGDLHNSASCQTPGCRNTHTGTLVVFVSVCVCVCKGRARA